MQKFADFFNFHSCSFSQISLTLWGIDHNWSVMIYYPTLTLCCLYVILICSYLTVHQSIGIFSLFSFSPKHRGWLTDSHGDTAGKKPEKNKILDLWLVFSKSNASAVGKSIFPPLQIDRKIDLIDLILPPYSCPLLTIRKNAACMHFITGPAKLMGEGCVCFVFVFFFKQTCCISWHYDCKYKFLQMQ